MLGALYACIAVGFSLVWGVLNVINMLHGSFIVLGGYLAFFAWRDLGLHPLVSARRHRRVALRAGLRRCSSA